MYQQDVKGKKMSPLAGIGMILLIVVSIMAAGILEKAIAQIARHDLLAPHGIMVAECPVDKNLPALSEPYGIYREYRYGKIKLTVYHRDGSEE